MTIIDTCVVVDYLRTDDLKLLQQFQTLDSLFIGIVQAELFAGIRSDAELAETEAVISIFAKQSTPETVWRSLGENIALLRRNGLNFPIQDVLLSTIAIELDVELWSRDNHFTLMQTVLPKLKLYQEPA